MCPSEATRPPSSPEDRDLIGVSPFAGYERWSRWRRRSSLKRCESCPNLRASALEPAWAGMIASPIATKDNVTIKMMETTRDASRFCALLTSRSVPKAT
jgi:hypothetical protein